MPELFESLKNMKTDLLWELIIVDNGSTDETQVFLHKMQKNINFLMRIVFEPNPGLGRARNAGVKTAIGDIIVFTDDDCYPAPNFLNSVYECFQKHDIDYLGGRILLYDKKDYPITIQESMEHRRFPSYIFFAPGFIQGANFSFRKTVFKKTLFNPLLGAGTPFASEDIEFIAAISFKGCTGAYDPKPVVFHHHKRRKGASINKLMRQYDYGRGAYFASMIIESKPARKIFIKNWYWRVLKQDKRRTIREIFGFFHYFFKRLTCHFYSVVSG